jgi:hypothetical protein
VLWNPVGRDPEELLVVAEGEETRIFVLSGRTAAALWTRLDGTCSVDDLAIELSQQAGVPLKDALALIAPFVEELEDLHLVEKAFGPCDGVSTDPLPWPNSPNRPRVIPFSPEDLAAPDLVAVGSYQGGYNNAGGSALPCGSGQGGVNDVGGQFACRPGPENGFLNAGWVGVPCGRGS